jgi:hypothetical protein
MTTRFGLLLPLLLAATVLSLSACAGQNHEPTVAGLEDRVAATSSSADSADLENELNDYVECLRKEGVNLPDPSVDADGRVSIRPPTDGRNLDPDAFTRAQKACGDVPKGLTFGLGGKDRSELQDTAVEFAQCMRERGVDMADPDLSSLGTSGGASPFGKLDRDNPKVAAAIEECQKVWTAAGVGSGSGGNG